MDVNGDDDNLSNFIAKKNKEPCMATCFDCCGNLCGTLCLFTCCGCCCNPYKRINQGFKGLVTRFGALSKIVEPGLHYINPISEEIFSIDTKLQVAKLDSQYIITKDNLSIKIDGSVYYKINNTDKDVVIAKTTVKNVDLAVSEMSHSALRAVFGQQTLQEALEKRKEFATEIKNIVREKAIGWGILIENVLINDITIPKHIQDLLARSAVATKEGEAELIMAKARVQSAHLMREAADQLNTPAAMQMRQLETYKTLSESQNSKIIFMPNTISNIDNISANIIGNNK